MDESGQPSAAPITFGDRIWHATIGSQWGNILLKVGLLGVAMLPLASHSGYI